MGKAKVRKQIEGYQKQLKKHIDKFREAKDKGAIESMEYEMGTYLKRMDDLKFRLLHKNNRKKG